MAEGSTATGSAGLRPAEATSPKRLLNEALLLALILGASLLLSALERRGLIPGQGYPSSLLLLALGLWYRRGLRVRVRFFQPRQDGRAFPVLFALVLVSLLLTSPHIPFWPQFGRSPPLLQVLHLLVLVPLSEELYFRGLLLDHLRRGLSPTQAVLLCSLLFGLLHLPVGAGIMAATLSVLACLLVFKSEALVYAFQLHVAWNGLSQIHRQGDLASRWIWALSASAVIFALAICSLRGAPIRDPAR